MKLSEAYPELAQSSSLPPGGRPSWDLEYEWWLQEFLDEWSPRVLDQLTDESGDIPRGADRIVNKFSISGHLFKWILGWEFPSGTGPTFNHRLRFLSVQFRYRRAELVAEAERYAAEKVALFHAKHRADHS